MPRRLVVTFGRAQVQSVYTTWSTTQSICQSSSYQHERYCPADVLHTMASALTMIKHIAQLTELPDFHLAGLFQRRILGQTALTF